MSNRIVTAEEARVIMGQNFFGTEEAIKYFCLSPTQQELNPFDSIPFSRQLLLDCSDTHILVAVFPLSVLEIRSRVDRRLFHSHENAWYNQHAFSSSMGSSAWRLVQKTPLSRSVSKTWKEVQFLLSSDEEVSTTQILTYTVIGHLLNTDEVLFEDIYVWCSDLRSTDGQRIYAGRVDKLGFKILYYWEASRYKDVGLSVIKKTDL